MGHNKERLAEQLFVQRRVFAALNRISFFMGITLSLRSLVILLTSFFVLALALLLFLSTSSVLLYFSLGLQSMQLL